MTIFCPNGHENPDSNRFCQACGTNLGNAITVNLTPGSVLGDRYRIIKEIGQGGFGRTYLSEDLNRFNELCVLKEFAPQVQGTALITKAQELFEREAGVLYRLQHPQIPRFREMFRVNGTGKGQLFLVQDYVAGETYQQLLRQRQRQGQTFSEAEAIDLLVQILPVFDYIHSLGVIHRDISPDNLIKSQNDGKPMLIDFGGVKQVAVNAATQYMPGSLNNSHLPTRLGKVGYAPNEQMQRGVVFPHSDLYALAATVLVLLTGKEPPELIDPQNFTWNWRDRVHLSPQLGSILDRMLLSRPADRFQSAQEVLQAIQTNILDYSTSPAPQAPSVPVEPPPQRQAPPSQVATVAVAPPPQSYPSPATTLPTSEPGLLSIFAKTSAILLVIGGAIGLGWGVANFFGNRSPSKPPEIGGSGFSPSPIAPQDMEENLSSNPSPSPSNSPSPAVSPIEQPIQPKIPAVLASKGVNSQPYASAVKQIYLSQNPGQKLTTKDPKTQAQLDAIGNDLGTKLANNLSYSSLKKLGSYRSTDWRTWRSQVNNLHLSERALIDLTDAKYQHITDYSAYQLGMKFKPFINSPMGQVYLATMSDRVQAIKARSALEEIIFPTGGTSGTVSGTLQPGEGKAFIASLFGNQDIRIKVNGNRPTYLAIYPPTSKLPPMLGMTQTNAWAGKTSMSGYHEFILIGDGEAPLKYELTLTADDLPLTSPKADNDEQVF
jgi:serine/threonine-protein kinase